MHPSAAELGSLVFQTYWQPRYQRILDIGALDINGSLRVSAPRGSIYTGIDLESGPGVDIVLTDPYTYPYPDNFFDFIVSTSCFEHDPMFWLTFLEASRVLAVGGILYINAPSNGWYHSHPWDNWRFYPDAVLALEMWSKRNDLPMTAMESFTMTRCGPWNDYVMVFSKGRDLTAPNTYASDLTPGVTNVRKYGSPNQVFNKRAESADMEELAKLATLVKNLQEENTLLRSASNVAFSR